ncbi:Transcriptional regulator [Umbelopsis sp. WA50703]
MPEEHPYKVAFRQYPLPSTTVKAVAPNVYELPSTTRNSNSLYSNIPSARELQTIKSELERLHPASESRLKHLRADLHNIEKVIKSKNKSSSQTKDRANADRDSRVKDRETDRETRDRDRHSRKDSSIERDVERDRRNRSHSVTRSSPLAKEKSIDHRDKSANNESTHGKKPPSSSDDEVDIKNENSADDIKEESPTAFNLSSPNKKRKWNDDSPEPEQPSQSISRARSLGDSSPTQSLLSATLQKNAERTIDRTEYRSSSAIPTEKNGIKSVSSTPGMTHSPIKVQKRSQSMPAEAHRLDADPGYLLKLQRKDHGKPKNSEPEYARVKAKDQVPIQTFWTWVEPYFNPLTEEDRRFLLPKEDDPDAHTIPPLGRHYIEMWAENEQSLVPSISSPRSPAYYSPTRHSVRDLNLSKPEPPHYIFSEKNLNEQHLSIEDLSCGALTERLISSMLKEDPAKDTLESLEMDDSSTEGGQNDMFDSVDETDDETWSDVLEQPPEEITNFEEKLQRELRYIGLLGDDEFDLSNREDDEVCAELRRLSRELKDQLKLNNERKAVLASVVEKQLQFEQYQQVLDMLDSQVDQIYVKHNKAQKSKSKRKPITPISKTMPENCAWSMQRRKMWVDSIGAIFRDQSVIVPKESIYARLSTPSADDTPTRYIDSNNSKSATQTPRSSK